MHEFLYVLPHLLLLLTVLLSFTGSCILSCLIIISLVGALFFYRIPKLEKSISDKVLDGSSLSKPIAHRGAGDDAPENTLSAIREAKKNGAGAIEFDVEWTLDGTAVLLHDDTVDRTTDGHGRINLMTYESTQQLDAAAKHPRKLEFRGEQIPTLDEAVQLCISLDLKMYIDVKSNAEKTANVIQDLCKKYPKMYDMAIVCSFRPEIIYAVRRKEPRLVTGLTHRRWNLSRKSIFGEKRDFPLWKFALLTVGDVILEWSMFGWLWFLVGNSAFLYIKDSVNRQTVKFFEDRGMQLVVWTVNDPIEKKYISECLGVPFITDTLVQHTDL